MLLRLLLSCLLFTGCYTQLSLFNPTIEDEVDPFYTYSAAGPKRSISIYAQDGAGQSLGLAYTMMYNRFYGMYTNWGSQYGSGYYNKYDYYNRYGYTWSDYILGGYTMHIPNTPTYSTTYIPTNTNTPRSFSTDRNDNTSSGTNLNVTRSSSSTSSSNNGGGRVSSGSGTGSAQSARVTRRN